MNNVLPMIALLSLLGGVGCTNGNAGASSTLPVAALPHFQTDTFNILQYGAKSDGVTLNTQSINAAIAACAQKGGGVVLVPGGFWLTGPIRLRSNVNLHLQKNALLQFTGDFSQYPLVAGNWEGRPAARNQSPISGTGLENIAITGQGIIDGDGDAWRMVKKGKLTQSQWEKKIASGGVLSKDGQTWYPSAGSLAGSEMKDAGALINGKTVADYMPIKDFLRPNLLVLDHCKRVLLEGVTFQNSPAWCLHPLLCEDLTIRNIYAKNPWYAQNGDGIDIESCKNILLEGSSFDVGDDGICIKSGRDEAGRKRGKPTENAVIRHCVVYHAHGGFVIGSEMSGGVRNIFVSDCTFIGTDVGLRFKTTRGRGGVVENIHVSRINMRAIAGDAILFNMYYAARDPVPLAGEQREAPKMETLPVTEATPQFRDFQISDITCSGAARAVFIRGLPEMKLQNVTMDHLVIRADKGIDMEEAQGVQIHDLRLLTKDTDPLVSIRNCRDISFDTLAFDPGAALLLAIHGRETGSIRLSHTDTSLAKQSVVYEDGATPKALELK